MDEILSVDVTEPAIEPAIEPVIEPVIELCNLLREFVICSARKKRAL
jgi:hypothetical protein